MQKDAGMACQKVCKQDRMLHETKGQHIGKPIPTSFSHLFTFYYFVTYRVV